MIPVQVNRKIYTKVNQKQRTWLTEGGCRESSQAPAGTSLQTLEPNRYSFEAPKIYLYLHCLK